MPEGQRLRRTGLLDEEFWLLVRFHVSPGTTRRKKKRKKNKDEKLLRFVLICTEFLWELQVPPPTPSRSHLEAVEQAQALSVGPDEVWTTAVLSGEEAGVLGRAFPQAGSL